MKAAWMPALWLPVIAVIAVASLAEALLRSWVVPVAAAVAIVAYVLGQVLVRAEIVARIVERAAWPDDVDPGSPRRSGGVR